jgi:hypothetical protein
MDDDSLGDLADLMGDDYDHGSGFDDGDPNIKPKEPAAPKWDGKGHKSAITVTFPAQKQFLTKLMVQAMPVSLVAAKDSGKSPFSAFSASHPHCKLVQPSDPVNATSAKIDALQPGEGYLIRLVVTNPTGTMYGKHTPVLCTLPVVPEMPTFGYASAKSVSVKFPAQGRGITKLTIEMAVFCSEPFSPSNKKKGMLTDTSAHIATRTSGLIKNLKPGVSYVFRLQVTNSAGTVIGPQSKPIKTLPRAPPAPHEDTSGRTDTTVTLKWKPLGHEITKLVLQYAILNGKSTFEDVKKNGGRDVVLADPQEIMNYQVKRLKPDTNYVFRLLSYNSSGKSTGAMCGPIKTVTFTPDMLDKSGWLYEVASGGAKKAKRSSFKKAANPRYWYTIDGKLLTWHKGTDCKEEVDYLHLGKVAKIEVDVGDIYIQLKPTGPKKKVKTLCLKAFTDDPNVDDAAAAKSWVDSLVKALRGEKAARAEMKAVASVKAVIAGDDELDEIDGEDGDDFEEEEGFGDFSDEEEDEGGFGDGFGGDSEDESEDEGGFGAEESEEEEASGFD